MKDRFTCDRPRRGWEVRVINWLAKPLDRLGVRFGSFSEERLLDEARRRTGLSDFGSDTFREALRVTLKAFLTDIVPNPVGRILGAQIILGGLLNRLWIQDQRKRQPGIGEEKITRPLVILGLPRTGTTLLHRLLAQDPGARPLETWETLRPASRPQDEGRRRDPRLRKAMIDTWRVNRVARRLRTVHHIDASDPEECMLLLRNTFVWSGAAAMPTYRQWLLDSPPEIRGNAYREYHAQLQLLQWQRRPASHFLLKSPEHLWSLEHLVQVLPDACIVQIHRDLREVVPSWCSLAAVFHGLFCDDVRPERIGPGVMELCREGIACRNRFEELVGTDSVLDLEYTELVRDPLCAVRQIYDHFGYAYSDDFARRATRWLEQNPKHKHGVHRYRLEQFGLSQVDLERSLVT